MVDINPLEPYIEPITDETQRYINNEVINVSKEELYSRYLRDLDCSREGLGFRLQQTISYTYIRTITNILYLVETYFQDELDNKLQEILELHNKNLEYEKLNPPIMYGGKKARAKLDKYIDGIKPARRRVKQTRIRFDENGEPVKSVAEQKLAAKALKLSALKLNIKL